MITRLAKVLRLASDRLNHGTKNRNRKNGEHRLSVEMLEPRILLAATVLSQAVLSQAVLSQTVVSQDYAPAAVVAAPADFDNDGDVDGNDLAQWESSFGPNANADADGDLDSDGADFLAWQRQFTGSLSTLFSDDFSTDTTGNYAVTVTSGTMPGTFTHDATGQRGKILVGDNNGLEFSQNVTATDSGTFSIDFDPVAGFPSAGVFRLRLRESANTYYEIRNTDRGATGLVQKFVNGSSVDSAAFTSNFSQDLNYTITVDFSPTETTVNAFGDILVLSADSTIINVTSFAMQSNQQDSFFDNILFTTGEAPVPDTEAPTLPTNLNATTVTSSQVNLAWTASTDDTAVTGYTIYESGSPIGTSTTTTFQHAALASTTYSYTVEAFDLAGNASGQSTPPLAVTTSAATGTTYYVDDNVNNNPGNGASPGSNATGDGTFMKPWRTIQNGVNHLSAGDTLIVKDGTYTDPHGGTTTNTLILTEGGTADKWITIKSENKWGAILDGQNETITRGINIGTGVKYVRIEGFRIQQYDVSSITMNSFNISNIYIYGNNMSENGISTMKGTNTTDIAQDITIDSNVMHDIVPPDAFQHHHFLYLRGMRHTVVNNLFYNNPHPWDIHLSGHGTWNNDFFHYIANNTIIVNARVAPNEYTLGQSGGILIRTSSAWIENNIIIVPEGKESIGGAINVYSEGNGSEDTLYFRNNLTNADKIWTEHDSSRSHVSSGWPVLSGNLTNVDPDTLFVGGQMPSAIDTDYKLKVGSPAIDAGKIPEINTGNVPELHELPGGLTYDYRHTALRPQGSAYDIGAFEFVPPAALLAPEGETTGSTSGSYEASIYTSQQTAAEETSEISPASQSELFDVALAELIGSSRDDMSTRPQNTALSSFRTFDLEPSAELAERFAINHRIGPAAPALRLSGDNDQTRDLEPTAQDREEVFDGLFTEFEEALIR